MKFSEVRSVLYQIISDYFSEASVIWDKAKGVKPKSPCIILSCRNLSRNTQLSSEEIDERCYSSNFLFEVNIYTKGKWIDLGHAGYYENTALDDMQEFTRYIESEAITNFLVLKGIAVTYIPPAKDISEIIGSTEYNFRSMAEFKIDFIEYANGEYGLSDVPYKNSSGGNNIKFANKLIEPIETIEMEGGMESEK